MPLPSLSAPGARPCPQCLAEIGATIADAACPLCGSPLQFTRSSAAARAHERAADADFRAYFRGLLRSSAPLRRYLRRPAEEIGGITLPVFKGALADAFRAGRAPSLTSKL